MPRIAVDIDGTILFDGELSDKAVRVMEKLQEYYHVILFTGRQDIPEEVWEITRCGESRKPVIDDYYTSGRRWKIEKYGTWKFWAIVENDPSVLKIVDVPVKIMISDESDWDGVEEVLVPGNEQWEREERQERIQEAQISFTEGTYNE